MSHEELERWVQAARAGSPDAFGEVARHYLPRLLVYLEQRTGHARDAEDLAQEALLRAWRNLHRYDPRWKFSTWLYTLAARLAASHRRGPRRPATVEQDLLDRRGGSADPGGEHFTEALARTDECEQVWNVAVQVLGEESRDALWLRYAEDLEPQEIARVLAKEPGTVRVMLHRARERVREALKVRRSTPLVEAREVSRDG